VKHVLVHSLALGVLFLAVATAESASAVPPAEMEAQSAAPEASLLRPAQPAARRPLRWPRLRERNSLLARHGADVGDGPGGYWLAVCVHRRHPRFAAVYTHTSIAGSEGSVYKRRRGGWRKITEGSSWGGGPVLQAFLNWSEKPCGSEPVRPIGRGSCGALVIEPNTDHALRRIRVTRLGCDEARGRLLAWAEGGYVGEPEGLRCRALAVVNFAGNVLTRCTGDRASVEFYRG
jgi:hypothetical protein